MADVKRVIAQDYHRNGVSGPAAVITLFERTDGPGLMIATTLVPDMDESLTPSPHQVERLGEKEAYINCWLDLFATSTVVLAVPLLVEQNIAFAAGNSWRGDRFGWELAVAWRTSESHGDYDPALEWYDEKHADPAETARLKAENATLVDEFLGRSE